MEFKVIDYLRRQLRIELSIVDLLTILLPDHLSCLLYFFIFFTTYSYSFFTQTIPPSPTLHHLYHQLMVIPFIYKVSSLLLLFFFFFTFFSKILIELTLCYLKAFLIIIMLLILLITMLSLLHLFNNCFGILFILLILTY